MRTINLRSRSPGCRKLSWLRLIASGQHPSLVTKHDEPTRILLDAGSVDRSGDLKVGVAIENLLNTGAFTASLVLAAVALLTILLKLVLERFGAEEMSKTGRVH